MPIDKEQLLEEIVHSIESLPLEDLSVSTISNTCGYSAWHFQRLFHGLTGQSLGKYIRARKLTVSAILLRDSERGILDISISAGFGSNESFTRSFKDYFGLTPKDFRRQKPKIIKNFKPPLTREYITHISEQRFSANYCKFRGKKNRRHRNRGLVASL